MTTFTELHDQAVRRQVFLEGIKANEVKKYQKFLKRIDKNLRLELAKGELTELGITRTREMIAANRRFMREVFSEYELQLLNTLDGISENAADFEKRALESVSPSTVSFTAPAAAQLHSAIRINPLHVRGYTGENLLEPFIKDFSKTQVTLINSAIRRGYYEGRTNSEILRIIRGTASNKFKDGLLAGMSARHQRAMVHTSVQHAATQARTSTWKDNDDVIDGYRWVSTLDSRTSQQCRSLDGQIFKDGKGPRPPIHINCRSTVIPELADDLKWLQEGRTRASVMGPVEDQTYYEWLQKQPPEFQVRALGAKRAKLFQDGGLSVDEFARLNVGRDFQPLTLEEMEELDPVAFAKAKI